MSQYIAYEGSEFMIEWYIHEDGSSQPLEYFLEQPRDKQRKALNLFRLMGDHGKIHDETKFRNESDGIYAFKPQPDRYLCFFLQGKEDYYHQRFRKKISEAP